MVLFSLRWLWGLQLLSSIFPDADGCSAGFLMACARLGNKAWHSAQDSGCNNRERKSILATNSMCQQGQVHLGSGGYELLPLRQIYSMNLVTVQCHALMGVLIDTLVFDDAWHKTDNAESFVAVEALASMFQPGAEELGCAVERPICWRSLAGSSWRS